MPKASSSSSTRPSKALKLASASAAAPKASKPKAPKTSTPKVTLTPPEGKQLASTEKIIRDAAIKQLAAFLSQADDGAGGGGGRLDEAGMRKLWKGLFYCFWMSDKPLVQQALASELSAIILSIDPVSCSTLEDRTLIALDFVGGFWECLVREWAGIDRLRLDKYYMFIRRFTHATFLLLRRASYFPEAVQKFDTILLEGPLCYTRQGIPPSLSWHLADIYLTELASSLLTPTPPPTPTSSPSVFVPGLFKPFVTAALHTNHATTFKRLLESSLSPLVEALDGQGEGLEGLKALEDTDAVRAQVMKMVRDQSGAETCRPEKRRSVLIWWREQGGGEDEEDE